MLYLLSSILCGQVFIPRPNFHPTSIFHKYTSPNLKTYAFIALLLSRLDMFQCNTVKSNSNAKNSVSYYQDIDYS